MMFLRRHWRKIAIASIAPIGTSYDIVTKDTNTSQTFEPNETSAESGWDRIRMMFSIDEFGNISSEVNSIYQAGFLGFLVGAIYGGVTHSREAYLGFLASNEATAFKSHLEAKRKLQDAVTMSFAKGGFRWGWRLALFSASYVGITTCISVYRGKSSIFEYVAAGTITGALYKINLGLRGVTVGGVLGCALGSIAGGLSLALLKASGTTMEEVRYWQYKWKLDRDQVFQEGLKKAEKEKETNVEKTHDEKVGTAPISLDSV